MCVGYKVTCSALKEKRTPFEYDNKNTACIVHHHVIVIITIANHPPTHRLAFTTIKFYYTVRLNSW